MALAAGRQVLITRGLQIAAKRIFALCFAKRETSLNRASDLILEEPLQFPDHFRVDPAGDVFPLPPGPDQPGVSKLLDVV